MSKARCLLAIFPSLPSHWPIAHQLTTSLSSEVEPRAFGKWCDIRGTAAQGSEMYGFWPKNVWPMGYHERLMAYGLWGKSWR